MLSMLNTLLLFSIVFWFTPSDTIHRAILGPKAALIGTYQIGNQTIIHQDLYTLSAWGSLTCLSLIMKWRYLYNKVRLCREGSQVLMFWTAH